MSRSASLKLIIYELARSSFDGVTPESQKPLVRLQQCGQTFDQLFQASGDLAATHDFIQQKHIREKFQTVVRECMTDVFRDGKVTLSDVNALMKAVHELAQTMNSIQSKRLGYVELGKCSVIPFLECFLTLIIQMFVPPLECEILLQVLKGAMKILSVDVAAASDIKPWWQRIFCIA